MMPLGLGRAGAPLSVLCLGAHSDDIEIGAGGTLLTLIAESARDFKTKPAFHFLRDGTPEDVPLTVSYAELGRRMVQAANTFHDLGIRRGDVIEYRSAFNFSAETNEGEVVQAQGALVALQDYESQSGITPTPDEESLSESDDVELVSTCTLK